MSGPHFEQLRTRLRGLELDRVGMEKLKNSHKGGVVRKFHTREGVVRNSHKTLFTHPLQN